MTTQRNQPRRPSLSMAKPMSWLSGSKSSQVSSPISISEPKLIHESVSGASSASSATSAPIRYGPLGAGATVVKTPHDASSTSMRTRTATRQFQEQLKQRSHTTPMSFRHSNSSSSENEPPSPTSPPLPPVPFSSKSTPELIDIPDMTPTGPNVVPALKFPSRSIPRTPPSSGIFIPPAAIPECPPQSDFAPILLSPPPDVSFNPSTLMITLDTSTSSLRTTYSTLTSRPSYLTDYLSSLARAAHEREKRNFRDTLAEADEEGAEEEDGLSLPPPDTPFASLFTAHLNSVGLVPRSAASIHLFLDRPSAPYTHILSYLRSPITAPAILPRSASLSYSCTRDRFDNLLELRDEAKYLGMDELYQLCCDELRQAQIQSHNHARASSTSSSIHSSPNNTSAHHNSFVSGSSDRGRTANLVRALREHQISISKVPNIVGRERHSGGSSAAISHVAQFVEPTSPISSPGRSRSRDQPSSSQGWI